MSTKADQATMRGESSLPRRAFLIANLGTSREQRLAVAFLASMLIIHAVSWWASRDRLRAGYQDFTIFYTAGTMLSQGEGAQLYDNALQFQMQQKFAPKVNIREGPLPYNHLPIEGLLFIPFAKIPYFQAYLLWDLLNLLMLAGALFVLRPHLPALHGQSLILLVLLGLAFFPVFTALLQGQDILLLLLLFALAYTAMRRNSAFAAGCWLGLGWFRFPLILPFVLILLRRKPWQLLCGFTLAGALMAVASAAVVGWKQTLLYPVYMWRVERTSVGPIAPRNMPNLRGLLETALSGLGSWASVAGMVVFLSLALLWFCSSRWKPDSDKARFDLGFSLAMLAAVLASYHAYVYDLSVLLIPVLLIANYCLMQRATRGEWAIAAPMFVLFLTPLYSVLLFRMRLTCLLAILLLAWLGGIAREISLCNSPEHNWR